MGLLYCGCDIIDEHSIKMCAKHSAAPKMYNILHCLINDPEHFCLLPPHWKQEISNVLAKIEKEHNKFNQQGKYYCDCCASFFNDNDLDWSYINNYKQGEVIGSVCPTEDCLGNLRLSKEDDKGMS